MIDVGELPVQSITGRAQFDILNNQQCVKPDYSRALGGVHPSFTQHVDITFQIGEHNRFVSTLIGDPYKDGDYFGRGICHWHFTSAQFTLTAGVPTQHMNLGREHLSADAMQQMHKEYCAAEAQYSYAPPMNDCILSLDRLSSEKRSHFYKVTIYNRRILP